MSTHRKPLLDSVVDFFGWLSEYARNVFALPRMDDEPAPTTDAHFEDWLRNDVKVIVDPNHRYSGNLSGFLGDSELENPRGSTAED